MNSNKPSETEQPAGRWHQSTALRTLLAAVILLTLGFIFLPKPEPAAAQPSGNKFLHLWLPGGALIVGSLLLFVGVAQVGIAIITYRWKSHSHD